MDLRDFSSDNTHTPAWWQEPALGVLETGPQTAALLSVKDWCSKEKGK